MLKHLVKLAFFSIRFPVCEIYGVQYQYTHTRRGISNKMSYVTVIGVLAAHQSQFTSIQVLSLDI